jgi:CelD/BcsL family acetyltransferase involved in cellulose biosynthesis
MAPYRRRSDPTSQRPFTAFAPADVSPASRLTVHLVDDWERLDAIRSEWDELAANAVEPSPSSEAWMLLPSLHRLAAGSVVKVLLMYASDAKGPDSRPLLCAVFPLEVIRRYKGLPVKVLRVWNHMYSLFPAPLLRAEWADDCVRRLLAWVDSEWQGTTLLEFPELRTETAFFRVLSDVLREDGTASLMGEAHTRALFRPRRTAAEYLHAISSAGHRKMRRQERRLSELGRLEYDEITPESDVAAWLDELIELEMSGWKGQDGTAFGSNANHRAYLAEVVTGAKERGGLMMLALRLDGRAIAMRLNFLAGSGSYAFKAAYDEAYFKYSPGALLELENIRRLHANTDIAWMDSLALPNHALINRVWLDRATIVSLLVAPGGALGELWLSLLPLMRWLKHRCHKIH